MHTITNLNFEKKIKNNINIKIQSLLSFNSNHY